MDRSFPRELAAFVPDHAVRMIMPVNHETDVMPRLTG